LVQRKKEKGARLEFNYPQRAGERGVGAPPRVDAVPPAPTLSIVVAALEKLDPIRFHQIDTAVFLRDATRPHIRA
jgi:hypothetical protein